MLTTLFQSGLGPKEIIYYGLIIFFALMLSFSIHEFMHAFVAGSVTARPAIWAV